jgi:hypothetical protein
LHGHAQDGAENILRHRLSFHLHPTSRMARERFEGRIEATKPLASDRCSYLFLLPCLEPCSRRIQNQLQRNQLVSSPKVSGTFSPFPPPLLAQESELRAGAARRRIWKSNFSSNVPADVRWTLSTVLIVLLVVGGGCAAFNDPRLPPVTWRDGAVTELLLGLWGAKGAGHYDVPDHYDFYARRGAFERAPALGSAA